MFRRHNIIVYGGLRNFLYKNGVYIFFCNAIYVITFRGNQKYRKHVHGDDIQDAFSPSSAIFCFISDKKYIRIDT